MTNKDNIILMCDECSDKRKEEFQKKFDNYSLEVGGFVKKCFEENGTNEHMWVKITSLKENKIIGVLDNEPIEIKKIKLGDYVEVDFNEIEDFTK